VIDGDLNNAARTKRRQSRRTGYRRRLRMQRLLLAVVVALCLLALAGWCAPEFSGALFAQRCGVAPIHLVSQQRPQKPRRHGGAVRQAQEKSRREFRCLPLLVVPGD